jgi:hypothetical protein
MTSEPDEYDRLATEAGERVDEILKREGAQAQALFDRIVKRHGAPTAKLVFERCIKLAREPSQDEEQEQRRSAKAIQREAQEARAMTTLPTAEQIASADRRKVCVWWYRLPARKLSAEEEKLADLLWRRYVEVGGYPSDFDPQTLPPTKKLGSTMRNSPNAELPKLFEQEKAKHGGNLTKPAFITIQAERSGDDPENIRKKLDYYLARKT